MQKIFLFMFCLFISTPALAEDSPTFRGDLFNRGSSTQTLQPPLTLKWQFQAQDKIVSSASIKDGRVFVGSRDHHLYALDEDSGSELWKFETQHWVDSSPAVTDTHVYFSSRDGFFYALKVDDGSKVWSHETAGTDTASPKVEEGRVYTGAGFPNKYIYAMNAQTGNVQWKVETNQMVYSSPALLEKHLVIGSNDGKIYKIQKDSGKKIWEFQTGGGIYQVAPAVEGNMSYLAAGNNEWKVYALNVKTQKLIWTFEPDEIPFTPNYVSSVAVGKDDIYVVMGYHQQELYAIQKSNGTLRWKVDLGQSTRYGFSSSPLVSAFTVYVVSSEGILKAFDVANGNLSWEYNLGGKVLASPSIANGKLYVGTLEGKFFAFGN